jgi:uncharacterized membrane protein
VVILQLALGFVLYGPLGAAPGVDWSSIGIALFVIVAISAFIAVLLYWTFSKYASERAVKVAMMTLTEDERRVLELVMHSGGEARQDKLRRQLDFSKSKLSALVNNLERKRAITKTRYHKTNILRLSKEFGGR